MDFADLNFTNTPAQKMELTHPTTEEVLLGSDGNPIWIELYGSDSDVFRKSIREYGNRKLKKGTKKQTMEELEQTSSVLLARATKGWSNNFEVDGEKIKCSEKAAKELYADYSWIREQVDLFINERSNFLMTA